MMVLRLFCVLHGLNTTLIVIDRFLAKPLQLCSKQINLIEKMLSPSL